MVKTHIDRSYEAELTALREQLLEMGGLVEAAIAASVRAIIERDAALAEQVVRRDKVVNRMEVDIDGACRRILALRQPVFGLFGAKYGIVIRRRLTAAGNQSRLQDEQWWASIVEQLERLVPFLDRDRIGQQSHLSQIATDRIEFGLEDIGDRLHLSPRTIHRRLDEEGSSFRAIKDALRRDMALARLTKTRDAVSQIAADLGYADTSAFYRAFVAWTGMAPVHYRRHWTTKPDSPAREGRRPAFVSG